MPYPIIAPSDTWFTRGNGNTLRSAITEIEFVDSYTPTGNENKSWDASASLDGSIMVYLTGTKLTIAGNGSGGIYANPDSSYFLADSNEAEWFTSLTKITNLALLNTSKVTIMSRMFFGTIKLTTIDVSHFDTSNVTDMRLMFGSSTTKVGYMSLVSLNVSNWDLSNAEDISAMFQACAKLINIDVSYWNLSNCKDVSYLFNKCSSLTTLNTSNWNLSNIMDAMCMFQACAKLINIDVSNWGMGRCTKMSYMFYGCTSLTTLGLSNWNTSSCTEMNNMFFNCTSLKSLDLSNWDVSKVTTFAYMFATSSGSTGYESNGSLETIDVSNWDVSSCTSMKSMFSGQGKLTTIPVHTWKNTSKCTDMGWMFWGCRGLRSLDVSTWDTSSVESFHHFMSHMYCQKIKGLDTLNLSSCKSIRCILDECYYNGVLDVSKWDTSNVEDFAAAFAQMPFVTEIKGLNNFDTSKGKCFYRMFDYIPKVTYLDLSSFDTRNATDSYDDPITTSTDTGMGKFINNAYCLQKVIFGENFSFDGNGVDCTSAVLPTPNAEYIPDTRGVWYNEQTFERYTPASIPNRTAATYVCVPIDVLVKHTTVIGIADVARRMKNTSDKMIPSDAISAMNDALDNNELYSAGVKAEYDRFWDDYQQNGTRKAYSYAFAGYGWSERTLKPKYLIKPVDTKNAVTYMFSNLGRGDTTSTFDMTEVCKMVDFSECLYMEHVFNGSRVRNVTMNASKAVSLNSCFRQGNSGTTENVTLTVSRACTDYGYAFYYAGMPGLIVTEGSEIAASIDMKWAKNLSAESLKSVIMALVDFTGTDSEYVYTAKFAEEAWATLEADSTAPGGVTWKEYVRDGKCWNI